MADKPPYLTAPQKLTTMPPGIPYIVGNEAAERFTFYGMRAILVVFMTQYLVNRQGAPDPMGEAEANQWYHWFLASNYFFPALGAIIADAFWGKYKTIIWLSLVYCLGCIVLALDQTRLGLFAGLGLIALGAGGIKPCVSAHVGDQFSSGNQHLVSRAFGWFYFSVNFGSFFSLLLTPWLLDNYGARWAFGLPAVLMLIATYVFWSGRYKFAHIPPGGKTFLRDTFNKEGLTAIGRLALLFAFVAVFWSLWDQSGGEWVLQAQKMDRNFLGFEWLSAQIQAVNAIMILAFIPLFQYVIYPVINKFFPLTPLRKIGIGLVVTGLSFLVSAWIETQIASGLSPNIAWQMPAYALLSAGEVMVSITALEFAYTQSPVHMKSIIMSLYLLSISAGNAFTALVYVFIKNDDGTLKLHGASYYNFYAALSIGCVALWVFVAKRYKEKTFFQCEAPVEAAATTTTT
jgi:POT family proton-dependent oligopeptide transporter